MIRLNVILADASLPDVPGLSPDSPRQAGTHIQPAFVALAVFALLVIGYLVWDFWRQKQAERRERARLETFREKKFKENANAAALNKVRDKANQ